MDESKVWHEQSLWQSEVRFLGFDYVCDEVSWQVAASGHGLYQLQHQWRDRMPHRSSTGHHVGMPSFHVLVLFLCAESFSTLLNKSVREWKILGFACKRGNPRVDHLFFTDYSLLFCRAHQSDITEIERVLEVYESLSGQKINFQKSSMNFSSNVDQPSSDVLRAILGISAMKKEGGFSNGSWLSCVVGSSRRLEGKPLS